MAVTVRSNRDDEITYPDGADWFIDEAGRLHVRNADKKHIAAYNSASWDFAGISTMDPPEGYVTVEQFNANLAREESYEHSD